MTTRNRRHNNSPTLIKRDVTTVSPVMVILFYLVALLNSRMDYGLCQNILLSSDDEPVRTGLITLCDKLS